MTQTQTPMTTKQRNTPAQNEQDYINLLDLFYLCLAKWQWFVLSLVVCLSAAVFYLLTVQPVYTRSAAILVKDDTKGKSVTSELESFSDLGLFTAHSNVNDEIGTLQMPDLMCEVVSRIHLDMD